MGVVVATFAEDKAMKTLAPGPSTGLNTPTKYRRDIVKRIIVLLKREPKTKQLLNDRKHQD